MTRNRFFCITAAVLVALPLAALAAQKCNQQTPDDAPASRYRASTDGTATDLQTGLMWMRCVMGQKWNAKQSRCTGTVKTYTWQQALQAVQSFDQGPGFAGHHDWRLPNLRELESIERYHCSNPYINLKVFPTAPGTAIWSSSPLEDFFNVAWVLDYGSGHATDLPMTSEHSIRLVRAGAFDNQLPPPSTATAPASSATAAVIN